jgi:hypothetical protein
MRQAQGVGVRNKWSMILATQSMRSDAIYPYLPVAGGAAFNSHQSELDAGCHPDTRVDLLQEIYNWADDDDGNAFFG